MIATRTLLQVRRPGSWTEVPHWLHLAASVIFVCLLFAGTAAVGAVALLTEFSERAAARSGRRPGAVLARVRARVRLRRPRRRHVHAHDDRADADRRASSPAPLVLLSYLVAALLLLSTTFHPAILLVFPAWVLMVSIVLLVHRPAPTGADHDRDHQPG